MQRSTVTLEFYLKERDLHVVYNNDDMPFTDFYQKEGVETTLQKLYNYLEANDADFNKLVASNWQERIIKYISNYFPEKKDPLDVIIHSNGKVTINKERR